MEFLVLSFTVLLAMACNYYRFSLRLKHNKLLISLITLFLIEINYLLLGPASFSWALFIFIGICSLCFFTGGGIIAALISCFLLLIQSPVTHFDSAYFLVFYLLFGIVFPE